MNIGVFGGTFDPVHNEHVKMAAAAIEELKLDKLIVVPTFIPPHKRVEEMAPPKDRIKMLQLAFLNQEKVEISDYEIKAEGTSYTYLTLTHFAEIYRGAKLYFLLGADMLVDFKTWKNPDIITKLAEVCVMGREGAKVDYEAEREIFVKRFAKPFIKLNFVGKDISSTKIRIYAMLHRGIGDMVPEETAKYIEKNSVYKAEALYTLLKINLTEKRITHTAGVIVCALKKAKELNLSRNKIITACGLHDIAKYMDPEVIEGFKLEEYVPESCIHQFLGAYYAKEYLGIDDEEIIDAIRYHTSGKANMSTLGKLVFTADMIEEGRRYDCADRLRALYEEDFEKCFANCIKEVYNDLKNKNRTIYRETINAYKYYVEGEK